jgi:RHS repeat-associated protein
MGGQTSYQYDLTGLTMRTAGAPTNTVYELRDTGGQLLSERSQSGGTNYVIPDAVGSTIGLVDANGNNLSTYTYDPFGNVLSQSGPLTTPFQFEVGKFLDWWNGLTKLGTRYYDSAVGRWTQMDPLPGKVTSPQTLNRYPFASNDCVNKTDPTGLSFWSCATALVTLGGGLFGLGMALGAVAALPATASLSAFLVIAAGGFAVIDIYLSLYAIFYGGACEDPYSF